MRCIQNESVRVRDFTEPLAPRISHARALFQYFHLTIGFSGVWEGKWEEVDFCISVACALQVSGNSHLPDTNRSVNIGEHKSCQSD